MSAHRTDLPAYADYSDQSGKPCVGAVAHNQKAKRHGWTPATKANRIVQGLINRGVIPAPVISPKVAKPKGGDRKSDKYRKENRL